ncbi:hypothetical protein HG536_0E04870 [Torulaspora globosa]|uniref:Dihydrolipoamide dehydrogenase-binding protein of pyruvate dehydrogenase complex n=1 Tax=Torulaspora globosa TaxID=48254 RepID=A0A7G3ZJ90_9SACH|nr:uncharacterized protein HG536_0E04870 [Torulaspora globosa]QLL33576.1 hypothetical protein HG536_0E04870 [Torulaspora globosa]
MLRSAFRGSLKVVSLKQLSARHMSRTARLLDAQVFAMPAMSPTMERGGIVEWKFKVGEPFSAGDVILEVETDKAQIDVEAQDDGKLAKIVVDKGAKDVPVGATIAYIAEIDDDFSTLEFPKSNEKPLESPAEKKKEQKQAKSKPLSAGEKSDIQGNQQNANPDQTLLPSVVMLLAENGISKEDAFSKIKATGKDGRILKGDVLAYLGRISADSAVRIADYVKSGERLDLSNIELKTEVPKSASVPEADKGKETNTTAAAQPEPIIFSEQLILEFPGKSQPGELQQSVRAFLKEAYHYTHEAPLADARSEHFDPIFEDLITPAPTAPRFRYTYQLTSLADNPDSKGHRDIFDLLSESTDASAATKPASPAKQEYALSLSVQVSDKFYDAEERSKRFVEYVKQLQLV